MAKTSGLAWTTLSVGDASNTPVDIRNDVTNFQLATPRAVQDVTGIDKSAQERLLLLADFSITMNGVYNPTVSHTAFATISSTSVNRTVTSVVAAKTLTANVVLTDYPLTRPTGGALTWAVPGALADGAVPTWS